MGTGKKHVSRLFTEPQTRSLEWKLGGVSKNLGAYGKRGAGFARELGLGKAAERLPWATTGHRRSSVTSRPRTREASGRPPAPGQASWRRGRSPAPRPALAVLRLDSGSAAALRSDLSCQSHGPDVKPSLPSTLRGRRRLSGRLPQESRWTVDHCPRPERRLARTVQGPPPPPSARALAPAKEEGARTS